MNEAPSKSKWTKADDKTLRRLVEECMAEGANLHWEEIAFALFSNNKSADECCERWKQLKCAFKGKDFWTSDEDRIIAEHGCISWAAIALHIPGRSGKQIRERWYNHVNPAINKTPWSLQEDITLKEAQQRLGNSWSQICRLLPGRSENSIKNRWYSAEFASRTAPHTSPTSSDDLTVSADSTSAVLSLQEQQAHCLACGYLSAAARHLHFENLATACATQYEALRLSYPDMPLSLPSTVTCDTMRRLSQQAETATNKPVTRRVRCDQHGVHTSISCIFSQSLFQVELCKLSRALFGNVQCGGLDAVKVECASVVLNRVPSPDEVTNTALDAESHRALLKRLVHDGII